MEKIIFNSLIKSTKKNNLWLNILSARQINKDNYIIEYKTIFENDNGEKIKADDFTYYSYLSEFGNKEQSFIGQLIKIRSAVIASATTITETVII
jgi:hypothetical protein